MTDDGQLKIGKNQAGTNYAALIKLQSADKQRAETKMACFSTQQLLSLAGLLGGSAAICGSERDADCLSARQPMLSDSDADEEDVDSSEDPETDGRALLLVHRAKTPPNTGQPKPKGAATSVRGSAIGSSGAQEQPAANTCPRASA